MRRSRWQGRRGGALEIADAVASQTATLRPWASLRCPSDTPAMEFERTTICRAITNPLRIRGSLPIRMPVGVPRVCGTHCANHRQWDVPEMIDSAVCRLVNRARRRAIRALSVRPRRRRTDGAGLGGPLAARRWARRTTAEAWRSRQSETGETSHDQHLDRNAHHERQPRRTTTTRADEHGDGPPHDAPSCDRPDARPPRRAGGAAEAHGGAQTRAEADGGRPVEPEPDDRRTAKGQVGRRQGGQASEKASGPNNVAASPQAVAAEAGALAAMLASVGSLRPGARRSTGSRCSCCRSTRRPPSSTGCRGRSSPRSTKSRPTTAPTSPSRPPARSAGCSSCRHVAAVRRGRAERRLRRPVQPGRRDLRGRALPACGGRRDQPARGDPRLQPLRRICRLGAAAGQADLHLPEGRDRDAHGPDRRPPAGDGQAALMELPDSRRRVRVDRDRRRERRPEPAATPPTAASRRARPASAAGAPGLAPPLSPTAARAAADDGRRQGRARRCSRH